MITFTVVIIPKNSPIRTRIPRTAPNRPRELTAMTHVCMTELYATAMALNTVPRTVRNAATASLTKPSTVESVALPSHEWHMELLKLNDCSKSMAMQVNDSFLASVSGHD